MRNEWILGVVLVACSYDNYESRRAQEPPSSEAGSDARVPDADSNPGADSNADAAHGDATARLDAEPHKDARSEAGPSITDAAHDGMTTDGMTTDGMTTDGPTTDGMTDARSDGAPTASPVVGFDTAETLLDFTFWTAPTAANGPGTWGWTPNGDPHLVQATNVTSGGSLLGAGTYAIYNPLIFTDGHVSVRLWSGDVNSGAVIIRYVDATHYYRFRVNGQAAIVPTRMIERRSGDELTRLATDDVAYSHLPPGHTLKLEAIGSTLRAYVDGTLILEADDPAPLGAGKAGVETIALADAHFDDFTVELY